MKTKQTKPARSLDSFVVEFGQKMGSAVKQIAAAAKVYATACLNYPDEAVEAFRRAYPGVTLSTFDRLRVIGNGDACPEVLLLSDRMACRVARLPLADQRAALQGAEEVEIVTPRGTTVRRPLVGLSAKEEAVVFDEEGRRRSLEQQRAYYVARAKRPVAKPYAIEGAFLVVRRACRIGRTELATILGRMK